MENGSAPAGLFIAISSPHQPVLPCTLAKWLLKVMQNSGVYVDIYKAQSTRSAGRQSHLIFRSCPITWAEIISFFRFFGYSYMRVCT